MLEFVFYTKKNESITFKVSEDIYERLAEAKFDKVANSLPVHLVIEDEECEVDAIELSEQNREKFKCFIEKERHMELKNIIKNLDENPTIKEFRECYRYVKSLTEIYELFDNENNKYFSFD